MNDNPLVLLLCLLMFTSLETFSQSPWKIDKGKDGIRVYTRVEKSSDFKSFKAVMLTDASKDEIIELLRRADSYVEWYGYTKTAEVLKKEKSAQYNYVETIFPWPYDNRDMVYRMSIDTSDLSATKISLVGIPDYIPERKGVIRMQKADGYILLKPLNVGTEITYVFHSEPGNIPAWLANNSIAELPFKTLSGLRTMLKKG